MFVTLTKGILTNKYLEGLPEDSRAIKLRKGIIKGKWDTAKKYQVVAK